MVEEDLQLGDNVEGAHINYGEWNDDASGTVLLAEGLNNYHMHSTSDIITIALEIILFA